MPLAIKLEKTCAYSFRQNLEVPGRTQTVGLNMNCDLLSKGQKGLPDPKHRTAKQTAARFAEGA